MPSEPPELHYTTPEQVAETMDLPDPHNPDDVYKFSNISHPTYNTVCEWIAANEDQIDKRLKRSWRVCRIRNREYNIPVYRNDENSWRGAYYLNGGYTINLRRDILPWDPSQGDKLELRTPNGYWTDVSGMCQDGISFNSQSFSFDYQGGKLMLRTYFIQPHYNSVRISYRYGNEDDGEVPYAIQRLCALMTAKQILNSQFWVIKVGNGGDIGSIKSTMLRAWDDEINAIISSYQRSGRVYTAINR